MTHYITECKNETENKFFFLITNAICVARFFGLERLFGFTFYFFLRSVFCARNFRTKFILTSSINGYMWTMDQFNLHQYALNVYKYVNLNEFFFFYIEPSSLRCTMNVNGKNHIKSSNFSLFLLKFFIEILTLMVLLFHLSCCCWFFFSFILCVISLFKLNRI